MTFITKLTVDVITSKSDKIILIKGIRKLPISNNSPFTPPFLNSAKPLVNVSLNVDL